MTFPYKLIDLTHILDENIPTWNGGCGFNHDIHMDYSDCVGADKFRVMKIKIHAGIGTHMDAPSHCIEGGKSIHEFDVNELCMACFVIDVSNKANENYSLLPEDIIDFENKHALITSGSCVMVKTGWGKFWDNPVKYHNNHIFPSISKEAAELLLAKGVAALGIDTLSPDRPMDGFHVHQIFLASNRILIENAAYLDKMPKAGGYVMMLPIKIKDGTEAPIRLVGLVKK